MKTFLLITFLLISTCVQAQNQWVNYNRYNSGFPGISAIEMFIDSTNTKWFATDEGLARLKGNIWTVWDTANSPIPHNFIQSIVKDKENKIWIATRNNGILRFDGTNWLLLYNTNLGYPLLAINRLRIDNDNTLWACSQSLGLLKYIKSLNKWIRYYTLNSGLPDNSVTDVKFEGNIKWIGTVQGGIARYDDTSWTVYNHNNTPLISDFIESVGIDNYNNKWFCTRFGGVGKFNSILNQWTVYTSTNSGLVWNNTYGIYFDDSNKKWIGIQGGGFTTFNDIDWIFFQDSNFVGANDFKKDLHGNMWICEEGVSVYNPTGVVNIYKNNTFSPNDIILNQNYPNPFNSNTKIKYSINTKSFVSLEIFDVLGKKINTLTCKIQNPGEYEYIFNAAGLSSGIYIYRLNINNNSNISKSMILLK